MIRIYPFPALRPSPEAVDRVVTGLPHSGSEAHPWHYEHVVRPFLSGHGVPDADTYRPALDYFGQLIGEGALVRDAQPGIYIYRQTGADGNSFEGLILGVSAKDYDEGRICRHENTLTSKQELMVQHISALRVVGEPVLLSDPSEDFITDWMHRYDEARPLYDFRSPDGRRHEVWVITDAGAIEELQVSFAKTSRLYIADGHHRIAASALFLDRMHEKQGWQQDDCFFMAYVLPESQLNIKPFHRMLRKTDAEEWMDMIHNASSDFYVDLLAGPQRPASKGEIIALTPSGWYRLKLKPGHMHPSPSENLDVYRLEEYVFSRYFHIRDSKTDPRLSFVRGDLGLDKLESMRDRGEIDGAFILFPNTMREIKEVADAGETMPPKSTYIEPKIPGGMIIQEFKS